MNEPTPKTQTAGAGPNSAHETCVSVTPDDFDTYSYSFEYKGAQQTCHDFPSPAEAFKGADFHLKCLVNGWTHEVCDGIGAIFRSHNLN